MDSSNTDAFLTDKAVNGTLTDDEKAKLLKEFGTHVDTLNKKLKEISERLAQKQ